MPIWAVFAIIIAVIVFLLLIKITVSLSYNGKFICRISVMGITVFDSCKADSNPKKSKSHKGDDKKSNKKAKPDKKENLFVGFYLKNGLSATVKAAVDVLKELLSELLIFSKRLKFRKFNMSLAVVGDDAADTAVKYGAICSAVYPIFAFADTNFNFKAEKIDISADFDSKQTRFKLSVDIKAEVIVLLITAVKIALKYKQIKEVYLNERK